MPNYTFKEIDVDNFATVQLLRAGKFSHGVFGKLEITTDTLKELKKNFDSNVRRVKLAVDYFHNSLEEAAGWIESVELREGNTELWINVDWTENAREKILLKEVRYLSADFKFHYVDSETGKEFGAVLSGAGLTNRPHIKDMKAIFSEQEQNLNKKKENEMPKFDDVLASLSELTKEEKVKLSEKLGLNEDIKLSESKAKEEKEKAEKAKAEAEKAKAEKADVETKLSGESAANVKLSDRVESLEKTMAEDAKNAKFNILLSDGKAVESQRKAFLSGDIEEFTKNAVHVNLSENGSGKQDVISDGDKAIDTLHSKALKLSDDSKISYRDALMKVRGDNPELVRLSD